MAQTFGAFAFRTGVKVTEVAAFHIEVKVMGAAAFHTDVKVNEEVRVPEPAA